MDETKAGDQILYKGIAHICDPLTQQHRTVFQVITKTHVTAYEVRPRLFPLSLTSAIILEPLHE